MSSLLCLDDIELLSKEFWQGFTSCMYCVGLQRVDDCSTILHEATPMTLSVSLASHHNKTTHTKGVYERTFQNWHD